MPSCAVITCSAKSISREGVSFYRFPFQPDLKRKWINATGREHWFPTKYSTICSKHFNADDFTMTEFGNKNLKPGACPSEEIHNYKSWSSKSVTVVTNCNVMHSDDIRDLNYNIENYSFITGQPQETSCTSTSDEERNDDTDLQVLQQADSTSDLRDGILRMKLQRTVNPYPVPASPIQRKRKLKELILTEEEIIKKKKRQIILIQAQNRRLKQKIKEIEDVIKEIKRFTMQR